jgi:hypothetical protein
MNIVKGMDRIALVLATIAILPGFGMGFHVSSEMLTKANPEYYKWEKELGGLDYDLQQYAALQDGGHWDIDSEFWLPDPPNKYCFPPTWRCTLWGFVAAPLTFLVVLFGIRGITRGTKWLSFWIVEGFRDEKKRTT